MRMTKYDSIKTDLYYWQLLSIYTDPDIIIYKKKHSSISKSKCVKILVVDDGENSIYFSKRQSECMMLFLSGNNQQEVANLLNISLRTIERYTKDMCLKLGCMGKGNLINIVLETSFKENAELLENNLLLT